MDEIRLTKDADALICVLYKSYLEQRKAGVQKAQAKYFDGSEHIHSKLMSKWSLDDIDETCRELSRAGLLHCGYGDDVVCEAALSDDAIIYMENRFKNGLTSLLGHLKSLFELMPW